MEALRGPVAAAFGEWSQTNIGDHAIHEGLQAFMHDCGWSIESYDFGALKPSAKREESLTHSNVIERPLWISGLSTSMPGAKRRLRALRQRYLMWRLLPKLAQVDAIIVGGGALLMDSNLHFPQSLAVIRQAARLLRKPLLCLGCSAEEGWSERGQSIAKSFLSDCEFLAVRDVASAQKIEGLLKKPVPILGDFALPLPWSRPSNTGENSQIIAVNVSYLCAPYSSEQKHYEDALVLAVSRVRERIGETERIVVFTTGTVQDVEPAIRVAKSLALKFKNVDMQLGGNLPSLRKLLRDSRVVIAGRLHAAILALAEGVPVAGFSVTPKIFNFFETLGLSEYSFRLSDSTDAMVEVLCRLVENGSLIQRVCASTSSIADVREQTRALMSRLAGQSYPDRPTQVAIR